MVLDGDLPIIPYKNQHCCCKSRCQGTSLLEDVAPSRGPQPQTQSIAHRLDLFLGAMRHRAGQELVVFRVLLTALTVRKNKGEKEQGGKKTKCGDTFFVGEKTCV